jgi:hypothetical protein
VHFPTLSDVGSDCSMIQQRRFFLLCLFICVSWAYGLDVNRCQDVTTITIDTVNDFYKDTIEYECAQPFQVEALSLEADVFIQTR